MAEDHESSRADPATFLKSLPAIRKQSSYILEKVVKNDLKHFECHMERLPALVEYVAKVITRDYGSEFDSIPPHGRWQHFEVGGKKRVDDLIGLWGTSVDSLERTRRLLDLCVTSVLLDAGAGDKWTYRSRDDGAEYRRSEGIAVASMEAFRSGFFSSHPDQPHQVDAGKLRTVALPEMESAFHANHSNPMEGLQGRVTLLNNMSKALTANPQFFGSSARPGNMLDSLLSASSYSKGRYSISVEILWNVLLEGFSQIWPGTRTQWEGKALGDAWHCESMPFAPTDWRSIVPFHKLSQWLAYSVIQLIERMMPVDFFGKEHLTGLPEYRNGGLFVDLGVLQLRSAEVLRGFECYKESLPANQQSEDLMPMFKADDDAIVEWRAATVGLLDVLHKRVNEYLGLEGGSRLSLAQVLEAGSWKSGREVAREKRPDTSTPPIITMSDVNEDTSLDILFCARVGDLDELKTTLSNFASSLAVPPPSPLSILDAVQDEFTGNTAVHYAAANSHVKVLQWIMNEGYQERTRDESSARSARFARANKSGSTPLHYAAMNGALEASKLLIESIAPASRSHSPEVHSNQNSHDETEIRRDIQRTYVELKNGAGRTAMFEAESAGKSEVAVFLAAVGAKDSRVNVDEDETEAVSEADGKEDMESDVKADDIQNG
ncbi:MAG: hypothetical protein M1831_002453 [Alyxoria varia]|nr:MAG: hypothetical protein M1831_002453 [Alyxoria varia]